MPVDVLFALAAAVFAAANLFCVIFFYQKPAQALTKACIMPFLAVYYALSARVFLPSALTAALLCWLGDIFLAKRRGSAVVVCGIAAFLAGNVCYTASILRFTNFPDATAVLSGIACATLVLVFMLALPPRRLLDATAAFYGAALLVLALCAAALLIRRKDAASAAVFTGVLCLIVSDICLALGYRGNAGRLSNFVVMLLYAAAQFCLLSGLVRLE
ncbi:MAG: lysoplasmalogenase [Spirochaetaceae bacterium]|jgi:uncharacterized membrane protein YhhN|nr:lysoplasmalogenase [Spirochaetaceae bacterium]